MIEGFRFTVDPKENNQVLPMNRRMFFRHSMVECLPTAQNSTGGSTSLQEDRMILELLLRQNEVKDKLVKIMQKLHAVSSLKYNQFYSSAHTIPQQDSQNGKEADFDCMPMNMDVLDSAGASAELQVLMALCLEPKKQCH